MTSLVDIVRQRTDTASYNRGREYYHSGAVLKLVQRGSAVQARVSGSRCQKYRVTVTFNDANNNTSLQRAHCSCPYSGVGWCKHIAATCFEVHYSPNSIDVRPTLTEMLHGMNLDETRQLLRDMVATEPGMIDFVDRIFHQDDDDDDDDEQEYMLDEDGDVDYDNYNHDGTRRTRWY